jgi:hypothetical protein
MLESRPLFKRDFNEIFNLAKKIAMQNSNQWTPDSESDPGITFLETFSVLKDFQQVYMEQISYQSLEKILTYLGMYRQHGRPAFYISHEPCGRLKTIPKGLKRIHNGLPIETVEKSQLTQSEVASLLVYRHDTVEAVWDLPLREDRHINPFGDSVSHSGTFYIGLTSIPEDGSIKLFFEIDSSGRNKMNRWLETLPYPIADLEWFVESIDEETQAVKSEPLVMTLDQTQGLIFSGVIALEGLETLRTGYPLEDGNYYIGCKATNCRYDQAPKVKSIFTNPTLWFQKDSLVKQWKLPIVAGRTRVDIEEAELNHAFYRVLLKRDKGYELLESIKVTTTSEGLGIEVEGLGLDDGELLVVAYDQRMNHYRYIGSGTGASDQKIALEFRNLIHEDFQLMICDHGRWMEWHKCEDLRKCNKYDPCYTLKPSTGEIQFGDGYCGRVPPLGVDNIIITGLSQSSFEEGTFYGGDQYVQLLKPGENEIELEDLRKATYLKDTFGQVLVTEEDYKDLVLNFPGLRINKVQVTSPKENHIEIGIGVDASMKQKFWFKYYQVNLLDYIEQYKVVTTQVTLKKISR